MLRDEIPHGMTPFRAQEHDRAAERLLERALKEVRDGHDAIPTVTMALAELRVACGELDADDLDIIEDETRSSG